MDCSSHRFRHISAQRAVLLGIGFKAKPHETEIKATGSSQPSLLSQLPIKVLTFDLIWDRSPHKQPQVSCKSRRTMSQWLAEASDGGNLNLNIFLPGNAERCFLFWGSKRLFFLCVILMNKCRNSNSTSPVMSCPGFGVRLLDFSGDTIGQGSKKMTHCINFP